MTIKHHYQEIQRTDKLLFICPYCGEAFRALAYHTTQKHSVSAKNLRKLFGLKANYQLITPDLKDRHREIALDHAQDEALPLRGRPTRYKRGHPGHLRSDWSPQALAELSHR